MRAACTIGAGGVGGRRALSHPRRSVPHWDTVVSEEGPVPPVVQDGSKRRLKREKLEVGFQGGPNIRSIDKTPEDDGSTTVERQDSGERKTAERQESGERETAEQ